MDEKQLTDWRGTPIELGSVFIYHAGSPHFRRVVEAGVTKIIQSEGKVRLRAYVLRCNDAEHQYVEHRTVTIRNLNGITVIGRGKVVDQ